MSDESNTDQPDPGRPNPDQPAGGLTNPPADGGTTGGPVWAAGSTPAQPPAADAPGAGGAEPPPGTPVPPAGGFDSRPVWQPREAAGTAGGVASTTSARPVKKRNFIRRHLALTTLGVILLLIVGSFGGFIWYLNHELGNIPRVQVQGIVPPHNGDGSPGSGGDNGKPLNILVLGADNGNASNTVADELADGTWSPGSHRSDTIILVHIPADRQSAQVISIPRDSWVPVPGFPGDINGYAKINAAFSWGGPSLAVQTVSAFTGLDINHVAMIDWNGFKDLTNALGGVRIYIPETFTDDSQHVTWQQGWQTLDGDQALQYVRTRHGLANGDFGRIQRQQNFMRTVLSNVISSTHNPITVAHVVGSLGSFLTLDDTWTNGDLRTLALGSRHLGSSDIQFTTAPFAGYGTEGGQSTVHLDLAKCKKLFFQFDHGDISPYLKANPGSSLPGSQSVK